MTSQTKTVSLVLGSGGARGLTHIGIIHWLEDNGYIIKSISGCSMGALIGGIYAIGKLNEYEEWVCAITKANMLALLDFSLGTDGLIKGDKIMDTLRNLVGDKRIEDLPISFTAVAANISQGKEVWLSEGPIFDAIRASISLPLFFTPFKLNGADLIDGGVLNPVPIAPTFSDQTDITIAVNLCGPPEEGVDELFKGRENVVDSPLAGVVSDFIGRVRSSIPQGKKHVGAYDIISQSFDAMQGTIARQKIAAYPPDYVLEIPRNLCRALEFDKAKSLVEIGYNRADELLPHMFGGRKF